MVWIVAKTRADGTKEGTQQVRGMACSRVCLTERTGVHRRKTHGGQSKDGGRPR